MIYLDCSAISTHEGFTTLVTTLGGMAVLETLVITVGRIGVLVTVVIPIEGQGALVITVKRQLSHYRNYR